MDIMGHCRTFSAPPNQSNALELANELQFRVLVCMEVLMQLLWTIIIGFVIGLAARFLMPGRDAAGFVITTLLGIAGAVIAQLIGQGMGLYLPGEPAGFIASVLGAVLVLFIANRFQARTV
jgi:uncharacterized membrane protein YeaQ/YmgE (transglycosylase-associated protein family)